METERLILDRVRETDRDDYFYNISHDKKVLETFVCRYAETPEELDLSPYVTNEKLFAIRLKATGRLIGIILYFDEKDGSCEIGYGLGSGYWDRGYATEAVRRFLEFLFAEKGFQTVCASFFTGNDASRRVMEKCGMRYSRFSEKELSYLGAERDLTYYAVTKREWAERTRLRIVGWHECGRREHWLAALDTCEWRAGVFLCRLLREGTFFKTLGEGSEVLLLTDGDALVSFCTLSKWDDVQPTELTPWIGFVYTFPAHRGRRRAGLLLEEALRRAGEAGFPAVYLSTNHVGLYEKYGFSYLTEALDTDGAPTSIFIKKTSVSGGTTMRHPIAVCGLNCEKCDAYLATVNDDQALREKTAKLWSELNGVTILPEHINCEGCRENGVKTVYCDQLCAIRQCALRKGFETCGACPELEGCATLAQVTANNAEALENLRRQKA